MDSYTFTNDWFKVRSQSLWTQLFPRVKPTKLLEIGSHEGVSACFLIELLGVTSPIELHCVDTWEGASSTRRWAKAWAPDVLVDAMLAFKLVRIGAVIAFDDYLWAEDLPYGRDPLRCAKPAIDAFVKLNLRKVKILSAPLTQLYVQKTRRLGGAAVRP